MPSASPPPASPIRSEYANDPEMADLIETFVSDLGAKIDVILRATRACDVDKVRRMAHQLRGSSAGYGYPTIGLAAGAVEDLLRAPTASMDAARREIDALIDMCRRAMDAA